MENLSVTTHNSVITNNLRKECDKKNYTIIAGIALNEFGSPEIFSSVSLSGETIQGILLLIQQSKRF